MLIIILILGILLSLYAFHISSSKNRQLCDINSKSSCSKALKSKKAYLFKVHNSIVGLIFYASMLILLLLKLNAVMLILSIISILVSIYLAIELLVQKNFCLVCILTYLINIAIFIYLI